MSSKPFKTDVFPHLRGRPLNELTPEERKDAHEDWLRNQFYYFDPYYQEHIGNLLARLDALRAENERLTAALKETQERSPDGFIIVKSDGSSEMKLLQPLTMSPKPFYYQPVEKREIPDIVVDGLKMLLRTDILMGHGAEYRAYVESTTLAVMSNLGLDTPQTKAAPTKATADTKELH